MEMSKYRALSDKLEKASKILSDIEVESIHCNHSKNVIKGEKCVYVWEKDSRRYPTPEEVKQAKSEIVSHEQKIRALEAQFAAI